MKKLFSFSNALTALRIVLAPFIAFFIIQKAWESALILFVVAALSDIFDGLVARWMKEETSFGAVLDPAADKILMLSVFGALVSSLSFPRWFLWLFAGREVILLVGGWWQMRRFPHEPITPLRIGKVTTGAQMATVAVVLINVLLGQVVIPAELFIRGTALLGIFSCIAYAMRALRLSPR